METPHVPAACIISQMEYIEKEITALRSFQHVKLEEFSYAVCFPESFVKWLQLLQHEI